MMGRTGEEERAEVPLDNVCILKANEGLSEVALKNAMYKGISKEEMMSTNKMSYNC